MKKVILLIIVIAVIAAGWFLYFNKGDSAPAVSLSRAKYMDLEDALEFSGQVVPVKMYSVMSETGGTVETIYASEGSRVNEGDKLIDLDAAQIKSMLKEAELNYNILLESQSQTVMSQGSGSLAEEKARIALALSQTTGYDYESFNNTFSDTLKENAAAMTSALSGFGLNIEEEQTSQANSAIALAEIKIQSLKSQLEHMSLKSLLKGKVVAVNINEGEVLSPVVPAMIIADTDNLLIEGYVYEKDLAGISLGMGVKIIADDVYHRGSITGIGEAAKDIGEQSSYGAMAKVEITPSDGFKKIPGAVVDIEIILSQKKNVLAVPVECVADESFVFVVGHDDVLEKRAVETGFQDTFYIEVLSGLIEGENVVLTPEGVKEGLKVSYDRG